MQSNVVTVGVTIRRCPLGARRLLVRLHVRLRDARVREIVPIQEIAQGDGHVLFDDQGGGD